MSPPLLPRRSPTAALVAVIALAFVASVHAQAGSFIVQSVKGTTSIYGIIPSIGGINGGTVIAINGAGFSRGDLATQYRVYIGTDVCEIDLYRLTDSRILCKTPPGVVGSEIVTVEISDSTGVTYSTCRITAAPTSANPNPIPACLFTYQLDHTPYLDRVTMAGTGEGTVMFRGTFMGQTWNIREASDNYDPRINGLVCLLPPTAVTVADYEANYCTVPDQVAGRYSFTMNVLQPCVTCVDGYGLAATNMRAMQVSPDGNTLFQFTQTPLVTSVRPRSGGILGGSLVTITGNSFPSSLQEANVSVFLSGPRAPSSPLQSTRFCVELARSRSPT